MYCCNNKQPLLARASLLVPLYLRSLNRKNTLRVLLSIAERKGLLRDPKVGELQNNKIASLLFSLKSLLANKFTQCLLIEKTPFGVLLSIAERKGFEPPIHCCIHAFQACALSHSATFPIGLANLLNEI